MEMDGLGEEGVLEWNDKDLTNDNTIGNNTNNIINTISINTHKPHDATSTPLTPLTPLSGLSSENLNVNESIQTVYSNDTDNDNAGDNGNTNSNGNSNGNSNNNTMDEVVISGMSTMATMGSVGTVGSGTMDVIGTAGAITDETIASLQDTIASLQDILLSKETELTELVELTTSNAAIEVELTQCRKENSALLHYKEAVMYEMSVLVEEFNKIDCDKKRFECELVDAIENVSSWSMCMYMYVIYISLYSKLLHLYIYLYFRPYHILIFFSISIHVAHT